MAQHINCLFFFLHIHTDNQTSLAAAVVHPSLFRPSSSSPLLSPPFWNDLPGYNYWVISTVITLNICSANAQGSWLCSTTVILCAVMTPRPPRWMKWFLYEWEQYGGIICFTLLYVRVNQEPSHWRGWLSCGLELLIDAAEESRGPKVSRVSGV